jgi:hypothetical protein
VINRDAHYEKSEKVIWVKVPDGLILNNLQTQCYLELDPIQTLIWSHLDGARNLKEVAETITKNADLSDTTCDIHNLVDQFAVTLLNDNFISIRKKEVSCLRD